MPESLDAPENTNQLVELRGLSEELKLILLLANQELLEVKQEQENLLL